MAARASDVDGVSNLTHDYNHHSIGTTISHVVKHVVVMGAMMGVIGLASPAFAAVPGLDPLSMDFTGSAGGGGVTAGDLIVQTTHGAGEMLNMIVDTFSGLMSIGESLITNTLEGNFAPSTWDSVVMSHGGEHMAGHAMAEHTAMEHAAGHGAAHIAGGAEHGINFDEWLRNAHASGELPYALEDSEAMGITLEEHIMNEYGHEGH